MSKKRKRRKLKKKPVIILLILLLLIVGGLYGYKYYFDGSSVKAENARPTKVAKDYKFNLVMVGDALIHLKK